MGKAWANFTAKRAIANHTVKNIDKAFQLYEKAYAMGCTDPYALSAYGVMLLKRNEAEKALAVLKLASKQPRLKPEQWSYVFQNLGLAYWLNGNLDRALRLFSRVYEKVTNTTIRGTYGFLLIAKGDETGVYDEAVAFNNEALAYDDEDPVILDNVAQLRYRLGDYSEARDLFEAALKLKPTQFDSLYYLATIYNREGRTEEAKALMTTALKVDYSYLNTVKREKAVELAALLGLDA